MKQFMVIAIDKLGKHHRHQFETLPLANKFITSERRKGLGAKLRPAGVNVCFHCKIDGETGVILQEWTSNRVQRADHEPVLRLFHEGRYNAFGASVNSAEEARIRARMAFQTIPRGREALMAA